MKSIKIALDIVMTALFLLLMKVSFMGIALHELVGVGIFILFAVHKVLNYKWIAGVCKTIVTGKPSPKARFMLWLDVIILLFVTFNVVSGILISQTILTKIEVSDLAYWSDMHHFAAYTSLVLLSVHIGLHWQMLMNVFKKLLGLTEANPIRTLLARATLVVMAFMGIKAITNPRIYGNFTAPFTSQAHLPNEQEVTQAVYTYKRNDGGKDTVTDSIMLLSTNSLEVEIPTLEEYLSKLVCSGCGIRCPLTALRCSRGTKYKAAAVAEYESTYLKSNTTPEVSAPVEATPTAPQKDTTTPTPTEDVIMPNLTPASPDRTKSATNADEKETSPIDYIGLMGIVIGSTHYTITIPNKLKTKKMLIDKDEVIDRAIK